LAYIGFIIPAMLVFGFVFIYPIIENIKLSVQNARFVEPAKFIGLANYRKLISDPFFWNSFRIMLEYTVIYTLGIFIIGFIAALLLNSGNSKTRSLFRTFFILPYAIPDVVAAMVFMWILDYQFGILNHLLQTLHIIKEPVSWLGGNSFVALLTIIGIELWRQFPLHTLIILSGLQDIPTEIYEAADIDGANKVSKFFNITLPHLKQILMILLTLTIIWCLRRFTMIWLLTQGGPSRGTETVVIQIYNYAFQFNKMSYAAAVGNVLLMATMCIVVFYFYNINRNKKSA
jgi:ABC-type sugar transport systems, permease components